MSLGIFSAPNMTCRKTLNEMFVGKLLVA